jgi:hypothetical protein
MLTGKVGIRGFQEKTKGYINSSATARIKLTVYRRLLLHLPLGILESGKLDAGRIYPG